MLYMILLLSSTLLLLFGLYLRNQFLQTAPVRQNLQQARTNETLKGMHYLRNEG